MEQKRQQLIHVGRAVVRARDVVLERFATMHRGSDTRASVAVKRVEQTVQNGSTLHLLRKNVAAKTGEVRQHQASSVSVVKCTL